MHHARLPPPPRDAVCFRRLAAILTLALALLLVARPAGAVGDPDLEWWTVESAHFRVHHPRSLRPIALRLAALSETIHDRLTVAMGHVPGEATHIVITDDSEGANGSAIAVPYNAIRLFVTAPDDMSPLGDYDDWLLDLVTHEYTHILHTDNVTGIPAVINAILGKTLTPNRFQPNWVLEGLAVVQESAYSSAGRIRGSMYEMFLRTDVIEDNFASIDQVSNIAHRWPQRTLWYLYGSRFLRYVADTYGENSLRAMVADYGSHLVPGDINRTIRRATGRTFVEMYDAWEEQARRRYGAQMRDVERRGLREGVRLTFHGRDVSYPRFVPRAARGEPAREEILFFRDDGNERPGLYRMPLGKLEPGAERDEELIARTNGSTQACFTPTGDLIFTSIAPDRTYYRSDLFRLPRGERATGGHEAERRRLSKGWRAVYPDVSPDGRSVAFSVNWKGTSYLTIADMTAEGTVERPRTLVPSARFEQAYTPRFSPDGRRVAYSAWTAGGYRDIRIVDVATGAFERVTHDRALDMQPIWSHDGKRLYFVSDRTGVFNVFALDLDTRKLWQVTNVRTGAFQPTFSADGRTMVYVGYSHEGFDLWGMHLDDSKLLPAPPAPVDRPDPPEEPSNVQLSLRRYNPLPTLAPRNYSFEYKPGNYGGNALTLIAQGADAVGHHAVAATLVIDTSAPSPTAVLGYSYGRLPVDVGVRLFHTVSPRGGYRISGRDVPFDEYSTGFTTGLNLPFQQEFGGHGVGVSYTVTHSRGPLPVGTALDPYATVTRKPDSGIVGIVHFGYGVSSVEGSQDASGPVRGGSLNIGLDFADAITASKYELRSFEMVAAAYLPMPWPGNHTIALRSSGAITAGNYPRGGIYTVGGYDLETYPLVDTITTGVYNGAFVLRGYEPRTYFGRAYLLETAEYRFPIFKPDRGLSTLPVFFRRLDGNAFVDFGGAFDRLDVHAIELFKDGEIINSPQLHASVGGELWFGLTFGYGILTQLRLGYAYGFSQEAIPGGDLYFVASGAF